jgi:hypothetical protein
MMANEFPTEYKGALGTHTPQEHAVALWHVYKNRWEPIWDSLQMFDAQMLEAEALWGRSVRDKCDQLRSSVSELRAARDAVIEDAKLSGANFTSDKQFGIKMRSTVSGTRDDEANCFAQKLKAAITAIEEQVRPHLRRG